MFHGAGAGAGAAVAIALVDLVGRDRWGSAGVASHLGALTGLLLAIGACVMAAVVAATLAATSVVGSTRRWFGVRRSDALVAALVAALVTAALQSVVLHGPFAKLTSLVPIVGFGGAFAAAVVWRRSAERARRRRRTARHVFASFVIAVGLLWLDAHVLRGRHSGGHLALELGAFFCFGGAIALATRQVAWLRRPALAVGVVALGWSALFFASPDRRRDRFVALRHLTGDPSTAGTVYARALPMMGSVEGPAPSRLDIERWQSGEHETSEQTELAARLRAGCVDCNIVVYFVDTLRADTASDPDVMPAASFFTKSSIRFPQTYSTASDTLRALSSLLVGRYDGQPDEREGSVLQRVRSRGIDNALFISTSANDYLSAQLPEFRFDEVVALPDHPPEIEVWGYGADTPTGDAVARSALSWMRAHQGSRFFSWIYNFDLHGWRQMKDEHVGPVDETARPDARYRAVAGLVDQSFRLLLEGLDELKLADRTIVLLVSDHGEALGYRGFWTHSTFLWQSLIRVPLAIRVPGLEPREVTHQASLVDIAPTISRFVDPASNMTGFHGVDLMRFYVDPEAQRGLPLLLHASSEGKPTMYGVVAGGRKLILPSAGGPPLLHDLDGDDPDETDLAMAEPNDTANLLDLLVASPIVAVQ
ncbi:MAG: sulfatase-like hydrolase/transferase [Labilithrix sp.]|nr:sulfatase-like hydrolase/transferase [Labilithrix sp.]